MTYLASLEAKLIRVKKSDHNALDMEFPDRLTRARYEELDKRQSAAIRYLTGKIENERERQARREARAAKPGPRKSFLFGFSG